MLRLTDLRLPLDHPPEALRAAVLRRLRLTEADLLDLTVVRRGHDARQRGRIALVYNIDLRVRDPAAVLRRNAADTNLAPAPDTRYVPVAPPIVPLGVPFRTPPRRRPIVVGAGPCGLFAALTLAEAGLRPILLERGPAVRQRTKDTWALWRRSVLDPESNVQFGEGGAGLFSDGKLYSGIKDPRYLGRRVLDTFVRCGAPAEILTAAKPHVGTFRLVTVVEGMRAEIEALGGEYRFGARVEDLLLGADRHLRGVRLADGEELATDTLILALGHSARDGFAMLHGNGVAMVAKPFSIGVRIEHPQRLIDRARFGAAAGHPQLGPADYKLVHHAAGGRGVYSFCMCPGGRVVAATSEPGRVVTNGMSQYGRAEFNANAGLVVGISPADYPGDVLAGIAFQRHWESAAFVAGGGTYRAPAQTVGDLLAGRASTALGAVAPSYQPGVTPTDLAACLPGFAIAAMREGLRAFDRIIPGYAAPDAVMTGVETRTSSPVRISRDEDFRSINTPGLYPAGEGAGFAGGILSAAVDGIRVAEAVVLAASGRDVPREWRRGAEAGLVYG